ncbi:MULTISPECIES: competence/damage-inducible protein A [Desulfococcus]|jgi:nicotinamide-nucleotide amidase|uniref:CinA-like protein n=1 Tax=Desulfococcus multivorans DSM 2059 TaxID=1121405 RepID=S7VEU0_DESML|nr:competence/damage-inducible protein A [Desulfococcus multivorans]AOY58858.1 CinA: competence-induced protein [Desulfococcus multivorans]AQV01143.1 competence/damage-inducible protein A [Desulfococcus multivorans]EPR42983.1 Competence-damaged protein [Desulfococcus multivorans DSM 2059]MDX9820268.1 competence/damage-inducible protein A [Desulfococcus multivorans]SJZ51899.1 competence/damage-inducible protein cinA [Desulfococcus multivorans DSM 2059]
MIAEILATGEELRTGALVDTNSAYLARELEALGIDVSRHQCVGDDSATIATVLEEIGDRADLALVTGGLGPTEDDRTCEAAARAAGVPLEMKNDVLDGIRRYFAERRIPMPPSNEKQALIPMGADLLANPVGTAPGFAVMIGRCRCCFMPGVPFEMKRMFRDRVRPIIDAMTDSSLGVRLNRTLSVFGLTESATDERLKGLEQAFPGIRLGLRAVFPEIQIKLYGDGSDAETLAGKMQEATAWAAARLGDRVFSVTEESMAAALGRLLRQEQASLALAESCTGGLIANSVTDVPGSSDYFLFSAVTYSNDAKMNILGVSPDTLSRFGAVSTETAKEMAAGVRRITGATYGLSVSGIAGPSGGTPEKPVGTVCIGLAGPFGATARRLTLSFATREMNKAMFAMKAMDMLRRSLMAKKADERL